MIRRFVLRCAPLLPVLAVVIGCTEASTAPETSVNKPTPILSTRVFADLTLGDFHSCGLTSAGEAFCWGLNTQGQSGNGVATDVGVNTPLVVLGGYTFTHLYAGGSHTCGIINNGSSLCWGNNAGGQLGDGSIVDKIEPTGVSGGHTFTSLTASTFATTCGLTAAGEAWCWGYNGSGGLGDGTVTNSNVPVQVSGGLVFQSISAGGAHTCGLTTDGTAYCWGLNSRGQVGDGTATDRSVPTAVATALRFRVITTGVAHTCGVTDNNLAYCWGDNVVGAIGDGTDAESRSTPTLVTGGNEFTTIVTGERHNCGLTSEGITLCWGYNTDGQLGDGTFVTARPQPVALAVSVIFAKLAAGAYHTCGISTSGVTYCWGNNYGSQLGTATP